MTKESERIEAKKRKLEDYKEKRKKLIERKEYTNSIGSIMQNILKVQSEAKTNNTKLSAILNETNSKFAQLDAQNTQENEELLIIEKKSSEIQKMLVEKNYTIQQLQCEKNKNNEFKNIYSNGQNSLKEIENEITNKSETHQRSINECAHIANMLKEQLAKINIQGAESIIDTSSPTMNLKAELPLLINKVFDYLEEKRSTVNAREQEAAQLNNEIQNCCISFKQNTDLLSTQSQKSTLYCTHSMELRSKLNENIINKNSNETAVASQIMSLKATGEQLLKDIDKYSTIIEQNISQKDNKAVALKKECDTVEAAIQHDAECFKSTAGDVNRLAISFNKKMDEELDKVTTTIKNNFDELSKFEEANFSNN